MSENGEQQYKQEFCVSDCSSTITSEACGQKSFEVSGPVLGQTTGLLSALRVSLRKSCVTRQASRMEIHPDNVQRKALVPQRSNERDSSILVSKPNERIGSSQCRRAVSSRKCCCESGHEPEIKHQRLPGV